MDIYYGSTVSYQMSLALFTLLFPYVSVWDRLLFANKIKCFVKVYRPISTVIVSLLYNVNINQI